MNQRMAFSQEFEDALRLVACVRQLGPCTTDDMVKMMKVPRSRRSTLCGILAKLAAYGVLKSRPGVGGGFALAKPAGCISVWDVFRAVGPMYAVDETSLMKRFMEPSVIMMKTTSIAAI